MDHALRSISYIADIGDLLVIMARRRLVPPGSSASAAGSSSGANGEAAAGSSNTTSNGQATGGTAAATSGAGAAPPIDDVQVIGTTPKMICHVFESEEVTCWIKLLVKLITSLLIGCIKLIDR